MSGYGSKKVKKTVKNTHDVELVETGGNRERAMSDLLGGQEESKNNVKTKSRAMTLTTFTTGTLNNKVKN